MNNDYKYLPIVGNTPTDIAQVTSNQVVEGDFFNNLTQPKGKPKTAIMPKTKAQDFVFSGRTSKDIYTLENTNIDENQIELNIGNLITGKADIVTPVNIRSQQLILAEGTVIDLESKLTPYDMAVHDAICTLVDSGRTLITTRQIAESMTGQRCESKGVLSAVTRSINKMRMTFVDIDYTAHLKAYGIEPNEGNSIIKNSNVIQAESYKNVDINGQTVAQAWKITTEPFLFTYAKELNQVATCPMLMLNVPGVKKNEENTVLIRHLAREIETMKKVKNYSHTMLFSTIYARCGISFDNVKNRAKAEHSQRKKIYDILDYWKDEGYINDYQLKADKEIVHKGKKGKTITAINIVL